MIRFGRDIYNGAHHYDRAKDLEKHAENFEEKGMEYHDDEADIALQNLFKAKSSFIVSHLPAFLRAAIRCLKEENETDEEQPLTRKARKGKRR